MLETLVTGLFLSPKRRCSACPGVVIIRTYLVIRQRMFSSVLWLLPKPVTKHAGKNIQRALMEVKTFRPSTRRKHDSSLAIVAAHKGVSASRETNDRCRVQSERWECDLKFWKLKLHKLFEETAGQENRSNVCNSFFAPIFSPHSSLFPIAIME